MAKSKVFWITRDAYQTNLSFKVFVWPYRAYPKRDSDGVYDSGMGPELHMCATGFANVTGITLAPGQRVKAQLVIKAQLLKKE